MLDASAALPVYIPEELSASAVRLLRSGDARERETRICVPGLFYSEFANVLWKAARRLRLSIAAAQTALDGILDMDLERVPTSLVSQAALQLAFRYNISAYDGCYAAAAMLLNLPVVSADRTFVRRLQNGPCKLIWLGDV